MLNYKILWIFLTAWSFAMPDSFFNFQVTNVDGQKVSLSQFKGKTLLLVNTASRCGYTQQYKGLQALQEKYSAKGFTVLAFPSNDFGKQEPGSDKEIKSFCELNYKINFPIFTKAPVSGSGIQPLFQWLTEKASPKLVGPVEWNFEKFLVDKNGNLIARFKSGVEPESAEIAQAIDKALK